jgi:hypothetical protein
MKYKILIMSDLHLGMNDSKPKEILNFLSRIQTDALILNGDIIDIAISNVGLCVRVNGGYWNNNVAAVPGTNLNLALTIEGPFFPVLCPGYEGTMVIQNISQYGVPADFQFLGNTAASVGFKRSVYKTEASFVELVNREYAQSFTTGHQAGTWLNNNGYWSGF